jgi:signal transduction histidine kinase
VGASCRCYTRGVRWKAGDRGLWLTLAALTALLAVLAALQYRWATDLARADAERRQAQIERSASRFVWAFDRELGRLAAAFRKEPGPVPTDLRPLFLERLAAWRRQEHAPLVSGLLLATLGPSGQATLEASMGAESAFRDVRWTPELEPLRERLRSAREGFFVRPGSLLEPPLAVPLPLVDVADDAPPGPRWSQIRMRGVLLLLLDEAYLRDQLFPQLAETHFGPPAESEFVVAIVRRSDRLTVFSSEPGARLDAPRHGDVQRSLGGRGGRPGTERPDRGGRPGEVAPRAPAGRVQRRPPDEESPWLLVARHRGGSLEQTVAAVRRRHLAVGLGVLGLLGASAVVLAAGAQRARRLARQQMEFVAGVTHELNTPLAAIRSAGQNLADGIVTDPAQVRRYGGLIEKEGGRLGALVAQVLDFAGMSGGRAQASDALAIGALVDDVLRDHRLVLDQAGMSVERSVPRDLPEVSGDASALRRVFANLVSNAAKFAAEGGSLAVRAALRPDGGAIELRFEDRGPGIPREERERVFEPFHRGAAAQRNEAPGSGLGLSVVRHVVGAHGGRVRVEGREGGGTAVVVELPVRSPAGATTA